MAKFIWSFKIMGSIFSQLIILIWIQMYALFMELNFLNKSWDLLYFAYYDSIMLCIIIPS